LHLPQFSSKLMVYQGTCPGLQTQADQTYRRFKNCVNIIAIIVSTCIFCTISSYHLGTQSWSQEARFNDQDNVEFKSNNYVVLFMPLFAKVYRFCILVARDFFDVISLGSFLLQIFLLFFWTSVVCCYRLYFIGLPWTASQYCFGKVFPVWSFPAFYFMHANGDGNQSSFGQIRYYYVNYRTFPRR